MKKFILFLMMMAALIVSARTIYVTRHGQVGDKKHMCQIDKNLKEPKITPLGIEQAELLADYLVNRKKFNGKVYASPIYRTVETATYIAKKINTKVILEPGIQEVARNKTPRGMTLSEHAEHFPDMTVPGTTFADNWRVSFEDNDARQKRVNAALDRILKESDDDLVLVSHGGVVGNVVRYFSAKRASGVKKPDGTAWNCALFTFELDDNGKVVKARYTTKYMPDEKVTSNFRAPKVPKPDDSRYEDPTKRKSGERLVIITRHCQQTGGKPGYIRPIPDDAGISKLGIKQSQDLGKELKRLGFKGKIYTSPFFRTVATGCYAAKECGSKVYPDARIQQKSRRASGNLKNGGATLAKLRELFPDTIADDAVLVDDWMLKKAETTNDQLARTKKALAEILAENPGQDIMIVSHGSGVAAYNKNLQGKKVKGFIWNCAIFKYAVDKKGNFRYLGYDHSFMPDNEVTSNLGHDLLKERAKVKAKEKSGVDYEF